MLLAGLWYDNEKPTMTTFLYPLMSSVNRLFQQGEQIRLVESLLKTANLMSRCALNRYCLVYQAN